MSSVRAPAMNGGARARSLAALAAAMLMLCGCARQSNTASPGPTLGPTDAATALPAYVRAPAPGDTAPPASAYDRAPDPRSTATSSTAYDWKTQALLDKYLLPIVGDKRAPVVGYCNVSIDVARHTLHVWWHGAVPPHVRHAVARATGAGVTVVIHPARYDERTLQPYVGRVVDTLMRSHQPVTMASLLLDCGGLEVGVAHITDAVRAQIRSAIGSVPVHIVQEKPPTAKSHNNASNLSAR